MDTPTKMLLSDIKAIYQLLQEQLNESQLCAACGQCCDFEAFGHRLYLTTPELVYFAHYVGQPLKPMTEGVCPYRIDGQCSVYPYRFAGCRIFQCKGNAERQSELTEATLIQFKRLCEQYQLEYHYCDLKNALKTHRFISDFKFPISNLKIGNRK